MDDCMRRFKLLDSLDGTAPWWVIHGVSVVFAHKAAVAHAMNLNHDRIVIMEEDAQLHHMPDNLQGLVARIRNHINPGGLLGTAPVRIPPLIRFAAMPWEAVSVEGTCNESCRCRYTDQSSDFCSLASGCINVHDASFYMVTKHSFQSFLEREGSIDMELMGSFDSLIVVPPITIQG